jgi:psiF repeat
MKLAITAALLSLAIGAGTAFAQTSTPAPAPAAPSASAPSSAGAPAASDKKAISKSCSDQANAKGLHGKARKKFRSACKHNGGKAS